MKTYWTIQHIDAWEQAKMKGVLAGDSAWAYKGFEEAYQWMMDQMTKRLECPRCYPIWLWTKRPDLRRRWYAEKGTTFILLEVSLAESKVLLSEYYHWYRVLYNSPLELYDDELVDKEVSWERIFNLEIIKTSQFLFITNKDKSLYLQGVTPAIPIDNIKPIKTFVTRF